MSITRNRNLRLSATVEREELGHSYLGAALALGFVVAVIAIGVAVLRDGTPPALAITDSDGDGWSDSAEATIGTNPFRACATNSSDNAWPADLNNDTYSDIFDI